MINSKELSFYPQEKAHYALLEQQGIWRPVSERYSYVQYDEAHNIYYKKQTHNNCSKSDELMYRKQHYNCLAAYTLCKALGIAAPAQFSGFIHTNESIDYPGRKNLELYTITQKVPGFNLHDFLFKPSNIDLEILKAVKHEADKKQLEYDLLLGNSDGNRYNMTVISYEKNNMKFGIFDLDTAFSTLDVGVGKFFERMSPYTERQEMLDIVSNVRLIFQENKTLFPEAYLSDADTRLVEAEKFIRTSKRFWTPTLAAD